MIVTAKQIDRLLEIASIYEKKMFEKKEIFEKNTNSNQDTFSYGEARGRFIGILKTLQEIGIDTSKWNYFISKQENYF